MMKIDKTLFQTLFILLLLIFAQPARAQEKGESQPPKYQMELVWIVDDGERREYVFVIGEVGFKTVDGLKNFIAQLPQGSILEWSPGCKRMGDEPLLSSEEEMYKFKRFCEEHGIEFILHPSG